MFIVCHDEHLFMLTLDVIMVKMFIVTHDFMRFFLLAVHTLKELY